MSCKLRSRRRLTVATVTDARVQYQGMLNGFPTMARLDIESAVATVGGYLHVVRGYPPCAVIKACERLRNGEAGLNRSYCPSEPEFHEVVRRIVAPYELQLRKTKALLNA